MNNFTNRANALFTFASTLMFVLLGLNAATRPFLQAEPLLNANVNQVVAFRRNYGAGGDAALVTFDIDADLTPAWTWNTKQMFVYVFFEYATKKNAVNQVVVWDRIVRDKADAHIVQKAVKAEYLLADQGYHLKNADVKLRVGWDMTPITGPLVGGQSKGTHFTMPLDYPSQS